MGHTVLVESFESYYLIDPRDGIVLEIAFFPAQPEYRRDSRWRITEFFESQLVTYIPR